MFREHSGRTNDMDTIEFATFRYDTVEAENGLNVARYKYLKQKQRMPNLTFFAQMG